jgi:ATPase components of ABC transporters with duplicated ATPase domains
MALINVTNLTFAYDGSYNNIFEDVSFAIDTDWKLGFVGRNGRGKTTFLKLLTGEYEYTGTITKPEAPVGFDYFPVVVKDKTRESWETMYDICPELELWQLQKEISQLDMDEELLYRPFRTLSSGEQTKMLLAGLFMHDSRFLLIDEPTNHLDIAARETVKQYLNRKKGFILVSHDRAFLDGCVDHILSINKKDIEVVRGNFSTWWQNKENRDNMEREQDRALKKDISRLTEAAKRTEVWSDRAEKTKYNTFSGGLKLDRGYVGAKSAKMMKRAKVTEKRAMDAAGEKAKLLKNVETQETLKIFPLAHHSGRLFSLRDAALYYDSRQVCGGVNFEVLRGERVALRGKNGSGKSSVLKLIIGEEIEHTGTVDIASGLRISYVPQDTSGLSGAMRDYAAKLNIDETQFFTILRKMDFSRVQLEKDMAEHSSGQKKKILIAASLSQQAHLYIWDEPLNFIDILSRMQIEELVLQYEPSMIFVEHDKVFCDKVTTKIVEL